MFNQQIKQLGLVCHRTVLSAIYEDVLFIFITEIRPIKQTLFKSKESHSVIFIFNSIIVWQSEIIEHTLSTLYPFRRFPTSLIAILSASNVQHRLGAAYFSWFVQLACYIAEFVARNC